MRSTGNTILVTGGGSGIGQALAQRWHDQGNTVIVTGRRQVALDGTISNRNRMHAYALDVDDPAAITRVVARLLTDHPGLNVLVNNAGIMRGEDIAASRDLGDAEQTITTNLLGPIRLIDALVDHLANHEDAAIINVTSGLAFVPLPATATYSATKAALHSYTMSLREQLRGRVEVIELAPPAVRTELTPGQSTRENFQPLDDFADEAMALLGVQPTAGEILVEGVKPLRRAEADGTVDQIMAMLASISTH